MPPTYEVYDDWTGRPVSAQAKVGRKLRRTVTVRTSDPTFASSVEAVNAMSLIGSIYIGTPHPDWPSALCVKIGDADSHPDDPSLFVIPVDYEEPLPLPGQVYGISPPPPGGPPPPPGQNTGNPPQPDLRSPFPKVSFREIPYYRRYDRDGNLFQNAAGDPLEDPPPTNRNIGILHWTVFKSLWSYALGLGINGKTNLYTWQGFAANTVRIMCQGEPITEKSWVGWKIDYTAEVDTESWRPTRVLNAGRRWKKPDGTYGLKGDDRGRASREIVLLDATGNITTVPNDLFFNLVDQIDFAIL